MLKGTPKLKNYAPDQTLCTCIFAIYVLTQSWTERVTMTWRNYYSEVFMYVQVWIRINLLDLLVRGVNARRILSNIKKAYIFIITAMIPLLLVLWLCSCIHSMLHVHFPANCAPLCLHLVKYYHYYYASSKISTFYLKRIP